MTELAVLRDAEQALEVTQAKRHATYPAYKPSGVDWLGDVPEHWHVDRVKWSTVGCKGGVWGEDPKGDGDDIICVRVADFDRTRFCVRLDDPTYRSVSMSERRGRILRPGDLLIEKSGGGEHQTVGVVMLYDHAEQAVCANFIGRMPVAPSYHPDFLVYLHAAIYAGGINKRSIKQTTGIQNLDLGNYLDEQVAFPPLDEQQAIARFLDKQTKKIDDLIEAKRKLLDLLKEKRQAVITHAVTKGLDPNAKLNPSGIDWLGDVPEHWVMTRLKFHIDLLPGFAFKSQGFTGEEDDVRLLRGANIAPGQTTWEDAVRWDAEDVAEYADYSLRASDIVFGMDRPWISTGIRVATIGPGDLPCLLLQRVARLRTRGSLDQRYIRLLLESKSFQGHFDPILTGVSVPHISPGQILDFDFPMPNLIEQKAIIDHIGKSDTRIRDLAVEVTEATDRLVELRTALVSATVTGKIDVRGA